MLSWTIHSLVLLGWAHFDRISAPPFDVIWRRASRFIGGQEDVIGERDAAWNALLDAYGFNGVGDSVSFLLLAGIQDGYFDDYQ